MIVLLLAACGEETGARSEPVTPTVKFEDPAVAADQVVWTDLREFLPKSPAGLPEVLAGLQPGMNGGAARQILEAAHEPGVKILGQAGTSSTALASMVKGHNNVGATLILDLEGTVLEEVQLSLPQDVAVPMLTDRWGPPTSVDHLDGAREVLRWQPPGAAWWAELQPQPFAPVAPGIPGVQPKKALLRYLPPQPSSEPSPAPASH